MQYTIRFTPEAEDTYDALSAQLMERWGERFVLRFESRVSKALDTLSKTPFKTVPFFIKLMAVL